MKRLKEAAGATDGDVDILLTCDSPEGVNSGGAPLPDAANATASDPIAAELAVAVRPRHATPIILANYQGVRTKSYFHRTYTANATAGDPFAA